MTTDRERIQILCALVARAERLGEELVLTDADLEAAESLDLEVDRYDGGDGRRILRRRREDPRREAIVRGLGKIPNAHLLDVAGGWSADRIAESILEELDR